MPGDSARINGRKGAQRLEKPAHAGEARGARVRPPQVTAALGPLIQAQIANAGGIGHRYTRRKDGKYVRVEDDAHIERLLTEGEERKDYWIFAKDPFGASAHPLARPRP
jgi:hypothetical protein